MRNIEVERPADFSFGRTDFIDYRALQTTRILDRYQALFDAAFVAEEYLSKEQADEAASHVLDFQRRITLAAVKTITEARETIETDSQRVQEILASSGDMSDKIQREGARVDVVSVDIKDAREKYFLIGWLAFTNLYAQEGFPRTSELDMVEEAEEIERRINRDLDKERINAQKSR